MSDEASTIDDAYRKALDELKAAEDNAVLAIERYEEARRKYDASYRALLPAYSAAVTASGKVTP